MNDKQTCTRDDLRIELFVVVDVDEDGGPMTNVSMDWDTAGDKPYLCAIGQAMHVSRVCAQNQGSA